MSAPTDDVTQTTEITTLEQLRQLVGEPQPRVASKDRSELSDVHRRWLAASPMCFIGTSASDGTCDVSPKGDPAGLALVLDATTIAIPERPGNRRVDGYRNVLSNPHVGLLFVIPGRGDTLRVNGRARLVSDAPWFDDLVVKDHRPLLALVVDVEKVFFHCAKAFLRSQLWDPSTWQPDAVESRARIAAKIERPDTPLPELEQYYGPSYADGLYRA
ncbi:pyridoxamine 5'-phosphate oxidase family protein [Angustibacter sp. McL0619]|uniref:pyridoxamine 5'-phosphate oxidase family protein n=1 Tax=Angustibacter sp. McL0619 TaxID=3415676 RepID=UPI003CF0EC61